MKIAFLSMYSGCVNRGVETYVHALSNELVKLGNEVIVYQAGDKLTGAKYKTVLVKVDIDWEKKTTYIPFINYWTLKVREFTKKALDKVEKDTDIVVATNGQWMSILTKLWTRKHNKATMIPGQSGRGFDDRFNLYTFPDAFVALTPPLAEWAKKINPHVKHSVIPNGVDLDIFSPKVKPFDIDLPRPIILSVGALVFWKRHDLTIKAMSGLKKGSLLIVGQGKRQKQLEEMGNNLLPGRFKIVSYDHKDMPKVYSAADLFIFSTVPWESFGIVMLEAMASGLGMVAADDPVRRFIGGDAGLYVDPKETNEFTKTIKKALKKDWEDKPRKQAEKFSWDEIAKKYEKLFESLLKNK